MAERGQEGVYLKHRTAHYLRDCLVSYMGFTLIHNVKSACCVLILNSQDLFDLKCRHTLQLLNDLAGKMPGKWQGMHTHMLIDGVQSFAVPGIEIALDDRKNRADNRMHGTLEYARASMHLLYLRQRPRWRYLSRPTLLPGKMHEETAPMIVHRDQTDKSKGKLGSNRDDRNGDLLVHG
jgi:hypothetical protein